MKKEPRVTKTRVLITEIIASLLILFFVYNVISIYTQLQSLKNLLAFHTIHTTGVAWIILIAEAMIALLLIIPRFRNIGFVTVFLFATYAAYTVLRTPGFPHDFGGLLNYLTVKQHLLYYGALVLLSLAGLWYALRKPKIKSIPTPDPVVFT